MHRRRRRTAITDMNCALGVLTLSSEICVSKLSSSSEMPSASTHTELPAESRATLASSW
jgi:hypothetical protein